MLVAESSAELALQSPDRIEVLGSTRVLVAFRGEPGKRDGDAVGEHPCGRDVLICRRFTPHYPSEGTWAASRQPLVPGIPAPRRGHQEQRGSFARAQRGEHAHESGRQVLHVVRLDVPDDTRLPARPQRSVGDDQIGVDMFRSDFVLQLPHALLETEPQILGG